MATKAIKSKVVIGEVRFSFAHVFSPFGDVDPKYSVVAVIKKSDDDILDKVRKAIKEVYEAEKDNTFRGIPVSKIANPLKDGDNVEDGKLQNAAYVGCFYIAANRKTAPGVVGRDRKPIINQDEFYSGCYGYISMTLAPYLVNGKAGIKAYLNHVMKTRDGERLGGCSTAEYDFADIVLDDIAPREDLDLY